MICLLLLYFLPLPLPLKRIQHCRIEYKYFFNQLATLYFSAYLMDISEKFANFAKTLRRETPQGAGNGEVLT